MVVALMITPDCRWNPVDVRSTAAAYLRSRLRACRRAARFYHRPAITIGQPIHQHYSAYVSVAADIVFEQSIFGIYRVIEHPVMSGCVSNDGIVTGRNPALISFEDDTVGLTGSLRQRLKRSRRASGASYHHSVVSLITAAQSPASLAHEFLLKHILSY